MSRWGSARWTESMLRAVKRTRWQSGGNLSFDDVSIKQPMQRSMSGGVEERTTADTQRSTLTGNRTDLSTVAGLAPCPLTLSTDGRGTPYPVDLRPGAPLSATAAQPSVPLTLVLPFPPTVNHSTAPTAAGGRYLTEDHRAFRTSVAWIVKQRRLARIDGRLRVLIELYPDSNRRWDIDNRCKAVLDALQHAGLFVSDEAVDDLRITRQIAGNEAWCSVTIEVLAK